ncbi:MULTISPECIES: Npun_F0296 family exosortase-dependent surface protein [unclassified Bradyrhizobium]|uniref:Npun_F0296 family exosortase-dependent surface protein n=1 Tax=unclassified Bradyrhizobium TaxID=2631580 RepID=UPI002FF10FA8
MSKSKIAVAAVIASFSAMSAAKADVINVTVAGPSVGIATGQNFNSQPLGPIGSSFSIGDWNFNAGPNSQINILSSGTGAQPYQTTGNYLSVLGSGVETITFSARSSFSFFWGSIDDYNTITLSDGTSYTGTQIAAMFGGQSNGCQLLTNCNRYVTFTDATGANLTGFTISSSSNSFEITNISAVPEASTWAMMILGFLGLGFLGYRKSSSKVSASAFRMA